MRNGNAQSYRKISAISVIAAISIVVFSCNSKVSIEKVSNGSLDTLNKNLNKEALSAEILSPRQNSDVIFKKNFDVVVAVKNSTGKKIIIDVSPDEIIEPPSETSGGVYKQRGSFCTIVVSQDQDHNGRFDFFSTHLLKIFGVNNNSSIDINPGRTHQLTFYISPWGPNLCSLPSTAIPGPARIEGYLNLIIDGQHLRLDLSPVNVTFIQE